MRTTSSPFGSAVSVKPWYRHVWPWLLMLGPLSVIFAGAYTTWLAYSHQDALVVDDYYKQGKAINMDLRRDRVAAGLSLASTLRYDPAKGKLSGKLTRLGEPYAGALQLALIHSTQPKKDIKLALHADQTGKFEVELPMLEMARWQVQLENKQRDWRLNGVWVWPTRQNIELTSATVNTE